VNAQRTLIPRGPALAEVAGRWQLAPNARLSGGPLAPTCHDRTPFVAILCRCGYGLHVHEPQLEAITAGAELEARCHRCRTVLVLPIELVRSAIADTSRRG
jgi:hypothetical protein